MVNKTMRLEWDEWEEVILQLDVQRALDSLEPDERRLVDALLELGSLGRAARELGMSLRLAQQVWESVRVRLQEMLREYGE